ncbi:glycosyltransferase [Candidatus Woesearchaeota archaeon]|nr:glycosyltransferase [Candidatus Woesearchaeota archaeon]
MEYSIIIPAHNEEKIIGRTLTNLLVNMPPNGEIIVVADACSDNTVEIAEKMPVKVHKVNFKNISKTRNHGASKASGKILIFNDADTLVSSNYVKQILEKVQKGAEFGCARWVPESRHPVAHFWALSLNTASRFFSYAHGNCFMTREIYDSLGGYREDLIINEDSDFSDRVQASKRKFHFLQDSWIKPSERKWREDGYLKSFIRRGFLDAAAYLILGKKKYYKRSGKRLK